VIGYFNSWGRSLGIVRGRRILKEDVIVEKEDELSKTMTEENLRCTHRRRCGYTFVDLEWRSIRMR